MVTRSIHDNHVLGYSVDHERREILIRTEFHDRGPPYESTNLRFQGVAGYLLLDALGGILLQVREASVEEVSSQYGPFLTEGRSFGWPGTWIFGEEPLLQSLQKNKLRVWRIDSSIGFDGFVFAQSLHVEPAEDLPVPSGLENDEKWYRVSLRFFGEQLDLDVVTAAVGMEPSSAGRKGEHIRGNPRYAIHRTSIWVRSYDEDLESPFSIQIENFLDQFQNRADAIRALTSQPGIEAELFLGFSSGNGQGGFDLPPTLLARLADLGIGLALDLYPPTSDEESTSPPSAHPHVP
jgi:hypothetical protein